MATRARIGHMTADQWLKSRGLPGLPLQSKQGNGTKIKGKYGGLTCLEWGKKLGVSKQAIHQTIKKHGFDNFLKLVKSKKYPNPKKNVRSIIWPKEWLEKFQYQLKPRLRIKH